MNFKNCVNTRDCIALEERISNLESDEWITLPVADYKIETVEKLFDVNTEPVYWTPKQDIQISLYSGTNDGETIFLRKGVHYKYLTGNHVAKSGANFNIINTILFFNYIFDATNGSRVYLTSIVLNGSSINASALNQLVPIEPVETPFQTPEGIMSICIKYKKS